MKKTIIILAFLCISFVANAQFFAGPSFSYGILSESNYGVSSDLWINDFDHFENRFNLFLGGGLGFEYNEHFVLKVGYDLGLIDTAKTKSSNIRYNDFNVTLAYKF